jgi:hypothetical protein
MKLTNSISIKAAINNHLLEITLLVLGLTVAPGVAFATTMTNAAITITDLTISADQVFTLNFNNGSVTSQTGLDSFGNQNNQTMPISDTGATTASASIATASANASNSDPLPNTSNVMTVPIPGTVSASSSVNLSGASSSKSLGIAAPIYQFEACCTFLNTIVNVTFSMTVSGLLSGSTDASGTYASEVTAQFGYIDNNSLKFIPILSFDSSDTTAGAIASQTFTGVAQLNWGQDYNFELSAEAQSSASEPGAAATPLPAALPLFATGLGGLGLLGWRRKKKAAALAA